MIFWKSFFDTIHNKWERNCWSTIFFRSDRRTSQQILSWKNWCQYTQTHTHTHSVSHFTTFMVLLYSVNLNIHLFIQVHQANSVFIFSFKIEIPNFEWKKVWRELICKSVICQPFNSFFWEGKVPLDMRMCNNARIEKKEHESQFSNLTLSIYAYEVCTHIGKIVFYTQNKTQYYVKIYS